ncbi:MAG: hypothetical protein Q8N23_18485 [Archangium sp.]|nr:hypothetical protein [Archangium sp.]MDP3154673.1 hypothetical protein [Archangium sp.]MDP3572699.1 hypothetical protein [Archangium sp.]
MRVLTVSLLVLSFGCAPEVPKQLDSPFSMASHSMAFANYADGYPFSELDADLAVRMFGAEVCQNAASPCELTPAARAFVKRANRAMEGGRCEGFAVLSSLFEAGQLDPVDFEGATARELTLEGNARLQRELAYWFATQLVPEASTEKTKQYMAKDVMPALASALAKDSKERWRIGIVRKKGKTISGGHALTPIGYYSDPTQKGVYWLRVYDNNRPDAERLMKIDTVNNRWEFEASENPEKSPRLYFGDASNKNPLYLAPVFTRQGTLPCEFCKSGGSVQVSTTGGAQVSASGVGVSDGELTGPVSPGFSQGLDDAPATFIYNLPAASAQNFVLTHPEDADYPFAEQGVEIAGGTFTVSVDDLQITATDQLQLQNNGGAVKYTNASGSSLRLKTELALTDGGALSVAAVVSGASSDVSANVDPLTGQVSIAAGNSAGAQVTMVVTTTNGAGEETTGQLTFTSNGDGGITADTSAWAGGDPLTGTVTNNGMTMTVTNACEDGVRSGMETDVDCGAVCMTKCDVAKGCSTGADCASTFCHATTKLCVATSCEDATRSGDESDVDCGGSTCARCALGQACAGNADCSSNAACVGSVCAATWVVGLTVNGLPSTAQVVVQNNGGDDLTLSGNGSFAFPTRVVGPYAVTVFSQPLIATCTVVNGAGTATADVSNLQVNCTPTWALAGTVSGLPMGESIVLQNGADALTLTADGAFTFNNRVTGAYAVTVQTQPTSASCVVANGSGTATSNVSGVTVTCATGYSIGGALTGLPIGQQVTLRNNGGDDLTLLGDGPFTFATRVSGAYAVTVSAQPMGAACTVSSGSGTASANVTSVTVGCVASGDLDPSFNMVGWLASPQGTGSDFWTDSVLNPDGTMTLAGQITVGAGDTDWVISKVTAAGTLDPSFGLGGHATLGRGAGIEYPRGIFRDGSGNFVVVGGLWGATDPDLGVARFTPTGSLDTTFGISGTQISDPGQWEYFEDVAQDATGRYVAVGRRSIAGAGPHDALIVRVNANGTLDNGFGTNGVVTWNAGGDESATSVAIDSATQDILVTVAAGGDTVVLRYNSIGGLVSGFGTGGVLTVDLSGIILDDWPYRVVMSGTNFLVVGRVDNPVNSDLVVARFTSTGAPDTGFGTNGKRVIDNGGNEVGYAITPGPAGGWYVGGHSDGSMLVSRISGSGVIDTTFGTAGLFAQPLANSALAYDLLVDGSQRIVALGTIRLTGTEDLGVCRILP